MRRALRQHLTRHSHSTLQSRNGVWEYSLLRRIHRIEVPTDELEQVLAKHLRCVCEE